MADQRICICAGGSTQQFCTSTQCPGLYRPAVKLGRLASGAQSDHGMVIHAVPPEVNHYGFGRAMCGTEPGRRSVGWATDYEGRAITCERCRRKVERLQLREALPREKARVTAEPWE